MNRLINEKDDDGNTALILAAVHADIKTVNFLRNLTIETEVEKKVISDFLGIKDDIEINTTGTRAGEISNQGYYEILNQGYDCGIVKKSNRVTRAIGGKSHIQGENPWAVKIYICKHVNCLTNRQPTSLSDFLSNLNFSCGGSIISERWILTASHCLHYHNKTTETGLPIKIQKENFKIVLGEYELSYVNNEQYYNNFVRTVEKVVMHERYDRCSSHNDIGLLKLSSSVKFGEFKFPHYITPVCLPTINRPLPIGRTVTHMGWGKDANGIPQNTRLMQIVYFNTWNPESCEILNPKTTAHNTCNLTELNTENQFCAGVTKSEIGVSLTGGDSGGPLIEKLDGVSVQVGIASHSSDAQANMWNLPGYYIDVARYIGWISEKTEMKLTKK